MDEEEKERISRVESFLSSKGLSPHCPYCQSGKFSIGRDVCMPLTEEVFGGELDGSWGVDFSKHLTLIPIVCHNCGGTRFLSSNVIRDSD